jgi:hypothetical protein
MKETDAVSRSRAHTTSCSSRGVLMQNQCSTLQPPDSTKMIQSSNSSGHYCHYPTTRWMKMTKIRRHLRHCALSCWNSVALPQTKFCAKHETLRDFRFSRQRVWCSELSSGMYCRVKWLSTIILYGRTSQKTILNNMRHWVLMYNVCCNTTVSCWAWI